MEYLRGSLPVHARVHDGGRTVAWLEPTDNNSGSYVGLATPQWGGALRWCAGHA